MFEFRNSDSNKENKSISPGENRRASSPIKSPSSSPSPPQLEDIKPAIQQQVHFVVTERVSFDKSSTQSTVPPPLRSRSQNILRAVPSVADFVSRKKSRRESRQRETSETTTKSIDATQTRSWQEKIEKLAEWLEAGGFFNLDEKARGIPEMVFQVHDRAQSSENDDSFSSSGSSTQIAKLLTPDEDLAEAVHTESCHPHNVPYFAKVLRDVGLTFNPKKEQS
jgi:hypothetical protein